MLMMRRGEREANIVVQLPRGYRRHRSDLPLLLVLWRDTEAPATAPSPCLEY